MAATTYFVALPFIAGDDGPAPVDAIECQSASIAKATLAALSRNSKYVGAIAFQRTGDPNERAFGDAEVLARFGETPADLSDLQGSAACDRLYDLQQIVLEGLRCFKASHVAKDLPSSVIVETFRVSVSINFNGGDLLGRVLFHRDFQRNGARFD